MAKKWLMPFALLLALPLAGTAEETSTDAGPTSASVAPATTAVTPELKDALAIMDRLTDGELDTIKYVAETKIQARQKAREEAMTRKAKEATAMVEVARGKVNADIDTIEQNLKDCRRALDTGSVLATQATAPAASLPASEPVNVAETQAPPNPVVASAKGQQQKVAKQVRGKKEPRRSRKEKAKTFVAKAPTQEAKRAPATSAPAPVARPKPAATSTTTAPHASSTATAAPCNPFMVGHQWEVTCGKASAPLAVAQKAPKAPAVAPQATRPVPAAQKTATKPAAQTASSKPVVATTAQEAMRALSEKSGTAVSPSNLTGGCNTAKIQPDSKCWIGVKDTSAKVDLTPKAAKEISAALSKPRKTSS